MDPDPLTVEPFEPEPRRFGCSVFALVLVLALTLAAPHDKEGGGYLDSGPNLETAAVVAAGTGESGDGAKAPGNSSQGRSERTYMSPSRASTPDTATAAALTYSGTASWYPANGDQGAVPWWRAGQDPVWASVCAFPDGKAACVTVLITGWCACLQGQPGERLIDLSDDAFRQLAPLSRGVIRVTMEVGTAGPGLPATDQ